MRLQVTIVSEFPNQNLKYAIDLGHLTNSEWGTYYDDGPPNQNPKCTSGKNPLNFEVGLTKYSQRAAILVFHYNILYNTQSNRKLFSSIPSSCISSLLPVPRDYHVASRLRAASVYLWPVTCTKRYTSFINYSLLNYQWFTSLCFVTVAPVVACRYAL